MDFAQWVLMTAQWIISIILRMTDMRVRGTVTDCVMMIMKQLYTKLCFTFNVFINDAFLPWVLLQCLAEKHHFFSRNIGMVPI